MVRIVLSYFYIPNNFCTEEKNRVFETSRYRFLETNIITYFLYFEN